MFSIFSSLFFDLHFLICHPLTSILLAIYLITHSLVSPRSFSINAFFFAFLFSLFLIFFYPLESTLGLYFLHTNNLSHHYLYHFSLSHSLIPFFTLAIYLFSFLLHISLLTLPFVIFIIDVISFSLIFIIRFLHSLSFSLSL